MPWKKAGESERFELSGPSPPITREDHTSRKRFERWWWRNMADWHKVHTVCPHKPCRRNKCCSTEDVACYREQEEIFRLFIFPTHREIIRRHRERRGTEPGEAQRE